MPRTVKSSNTPPTQDKGAGLRRNADEKLSRAMVNSITEYAVILTDPNGLIISLNKGAELIMGYRESEVAGQSIAVFYLPETLSADGPATNLQEALVNNNYHVKGRRVKKDGIIFLADIQYTALYDDDRALLGYTKIIHELTDKTENEGKRETIKPAIGGNISFRKLIENSYSGITLLDKNFDVIYRSQSADRITGWNTEDRKKVEMDQVVHPEDHQLVNDVLKEVLRSPGIARQCTFRSKRSDGNYLWLDCVYTNFLDEPNVNAIVCNFIDVSESKQADDLLRKTVKELSAYQYALDESSIVAITDQKGIIQHVNGNFCKISKYSREELIGKDHRIINSGYHSKAFIKSLWAAIAKGQIWRGELKNKAKDGAEYWVDTTIVPFLNENGKPYQYIAIRSDITERKLNQEKIVERERFIKTITDNLPALIAYWTADLHCLFANKPYAHWFGKQPEEMIGIRKENLIDKEEFKLHEIHIAGVLAGHAQSFERNFVKPTGGRIYTQTQYIPDKSGDVVKGFYSLIYDITEITRAEHEILEKTHQIENLLENILDGFIALDENRRYTYANEQIGRFIKIPPASLIGKCIWDVFPDLVGSGIYEAIERVYKEKISITLEDYYAPFNTWQENRVYPHDSGVSIFIRDITKHKREEQHLKLLESAITNTTDAIMITEAEPHDEPGPRILYVNEAFTRMTGYTAADVIGKSPRLLQGPRTDRVALTYLHNCMREWQHCEISVINYKKDGEEFWINISITPVADDTGWFTHWVAIERDITGQKIEEQQNALLASISNIFNEPLELNELLVKALQKLVEFGDFGMAEAWLNSTDRKKTNLVATYSTDAGIDTFYKEAATIKSFVKGEGLVGMVWDSNSVQFLEDIGQNENFKRRKAAHSAGLKNAYGVPLRYKTEIIGVLVLGLTRDEKLNEIFTKFFEQLSGSMGAEIKRKQLEEELYQLFTWAPDIICTAGSDGYFKKVNPAMINLLGYTELELLNRPLFDFMHPDDKKVSSDEFDGINNGKAILHFENRYITSSGKVKCIAWATSAASPEGLIFCVGKDITERKELSDLLEKANSLARIGAWDIDLERGIVHWSDITREIHDAAPNFEPDLEAATNFYKEGENRETITRCMTNAVKYGTSSDVELQIITTKGNIKWVRVIVEAEFQQRKCVKLYGSFQDIDARKRAEISVTEVLEERNTILESIGDAFFAVDKNWTVTYWNNMAEKAMQMPRNMILGHNLWEIFSDIWGTERPNKYLNAMKTGKADHEELYSERLKAWIEVSIYPAFNGLSVYIKDVTARKEAEATATEVLEERNTILESIADAFFAVDINWTVTYWNNMAEKVLGKSKQEMLNCNLWEIFNNSIGSESYQKYHEAVSSKQARHFEDYYGPLGKWYEISAYPSDSGLSVYFKDVTERKISDIRLKELNESLQIQTKELATSNAELEQFAYVASHDLQEPLRMVTSFLSQIERKYNDKLDDKGRQYINFAVDGAKRMRQIILDLLEFSRVGSMDDPMEQINLSKVVNDVTALYRKQIEEKNATIKYDHLPVITSYKTPIRQIFQNLIGNSLKYNDGIVRPIIQVTCKEAKEHWLLAVKDNGIGIDPEYFDKIFIIFQRLHNKDEYSGTGMGLSITKKLVDNLGGRIWVESGPGKGSTFYFTILKH